MTVLLKLLLQLCVYTINTIITFFESVPGHVALDVSTDRACKVGAMTEGNILGTEKQFLLYLLPGYIKKLPNRN